MSSAIIAKHGIINDQGSSSAKISPLTTGYQQTAADTAKQGLGFGLTLDMARLDQNHNMMQSHHNYNNNNNN
jgi:hypothetical protein